MTMIDNDIEVLIERTWWQIREIQDRHQKELAPYLKILLDVQAMQPPSPVFIDYSKLSDAEKAFWDDRVKEMEKGL